jgi:hypothetical protein
VCRAGQPIEASEDSQLADRYEGSTELEAHRLTPYVYVARHLDRTAARTVNVTPIAHTGNTRQLFSVAPRLLRLVGRLWMSRAHHRARYAEVVHSHATCRLNRC